MPLESHRNTFEKGMTKDYTIVMQPDGTYRHMVNCSLISQDGNNYVIKDILGNVKTIVLPIRYDTSSTTFDLPPTPIGFISFPDKLIVFFTNNTTEGGQYGEIGRLDYVPYGEGVQPVVVAGSVTPGYTPLYHHIGLNFTILQQIEGFAFPENNLIQRVYWTDDLNEPRVLDVGNPIYSTYIPSGSLITGNKYMVLEGVITHNTKNYGPTTGVAGAGFPGNIFTAANANYTSVTGTAPTPKVIAYVPLELLNFTPSRSLGNIHFTGYGAGAKYCGNKMYFYRLLSPSQGITTSWSYGSFPIPVRLGGANAYFLDIGGGTSTTLVNSGKAVNLQITNIDVNFSRIQIAVAEFDQLLDVPRVIAIIIDTPITASTMNFVDAGNTNVGTLTLSDLTLFPASILRIKTMTTNKNYALIANIQERGEFVFDKGTVTIEQMNYPLPAHRNPNWTSGPSCANVMTYVPIDYNPFANPSGANAIQPYTNWVVTNIAGGVVTYNGNNYTLGETFVGVPSVFVVVIPAGSEIRPCVVKNKYTTNAGAGNKPRPDTLILSSGYWDYKDPSVATHIKGLWNNEKYRYGILFYDKKGNPFYVRHLTDIDTDYINISPLLGTGGPSFEENDNVGPVLYLLQKGVRLSGITISPAIAAQISGFSIVRAERDARIMTQGLMMQTSDSTAVLAGVTVIQPTASVKLSNDNNVGSRAKYYSLICPDSLVQFPIPHFANGISLNGTSIEEAYWVFPKDQSQNQLANAGYMKTVNGASNEAETKYFLTEGAVSSPPQTEGITSQFTCNEKANLNQFSNSAIYYQNVTATNNNINLDTQCFSGAANTTNTLPVNTVAAGGLRTILELSADSLLDFNSLVNTYASVPNSGLYKMVVNIVIQNSAQYGGNSDTALASTNYISTGHFQEINSTVLSETLDVNGNYTFNDVEVFGGDCFTCLADYGYGLYDDSAVIPSTGAPAGSYSWGIKFPCQCNSNYTLRNGNPRRSVAPDFMHSNPSPGNGVYYKIGVTSQLEGFQYNQGYSSDGHFVAYPALPINYSLANLFPYRIRFAGQKIPGELINSFRTFLINDLKDTDGQGGEINNLRTKDGRTIVWQNDIISTVPILERVINSSTDGSATVLGTGGVVDRFDPVNSYFGNQHQWGLTITEYGFAWFDMRRKAVLSLSFNEGIAEISKIEGLKGFFDEIFLEVVGNTSPINNNLLNDPTFSKYSDRPLTGVGICGVYDPKFKVTYLTFKFINRNATKSYNKDFTIMYSHFDKMFIGFTDCTPGISWNHNQEVLAANNPKNKLTYFAAAMPSTDFVIGDVVPYLNAEWICISPVTIASYPGSGTTAPDVVNSTFWKKINQTNELWVHNQPKLLGQSIAPDYLYDSFFGQIVNNEGWYVVNPKVANPFAVTNMEQEGNGVNFTDLTIQAESVTATDASISPTSRFYRVIWDKICSNMPFAFTGRISNSYLLVKWKKVNWSSDPTVVSKPVRIVRWIVSFFEQKR